MVKVFFFFAATVCFLGACSNSSDTECDATEESPISEEAPVTEESSSSEAVAIPEETDSTKEFHKGMILVEGSETLIAIGTNKTGAKESEKPELKTILDYDYFMDSTLVTCKDFKATMEGTKLAQSLKCNDNEPVTDITFFDAVLFANKKSKSEKFDSVYDYSKATFDSDGHCTNLNSFLFHEDRKGYRLPTEAEWIKAATSSYEFHYFSEKPKEWSNDYLGKLKDTTIINFAGAKNANDLGERIVKSYNKSSDSANADLYSRGDVYTVTSASHADYIGFRLAIGAIPNAVWLDSKGSASSSPITILANSADLWDISKTTDMKLAFRNYQTGNLAYIDYAAGGSAVIEINDTIPVFHPDISPDGEKVAFCTGIEGVSSQSNVYVRNLDFSGSNLVKLNINGAAIPRWNVLENGDTVITYVSNPGNNKDEATFKSYSTWQVPFANGKFGTPQKLFDGAYHGGISNGLAVSGARLLRARVHDKDTIWYNSEQACNASLSKDDSKRTAFLDFGGKTGQAFIGKRYATHQYILIADSTGNLIQYTQAPMGYTFDHSEWTVGEASNNIVATLVNSDGAHKRISLINLNDSNSIDLAEGEDLWHPCFWIKPKEKQNTQFAIDPDSAGVYYNNSGTASNDIIFRYKMELLWEFKDSANVVILGSSRPYNGIISRNFNKNILAVNLAVPSMTIVGNSNFFYRYIKPHFKKLKVVVIGIDLDRGHLPGTISSNMFYRSYQSYPGYVYDENHNYWVDSYPEGLYEATHKAPGNGWYATGILPSRGHKNEPSNGWGLPIVEEDSNWVNWEETSARELEEKYMRFEKFLQVCNENNITVIGVILPQNPAYKETGALGRHGMLRSVVPANMERLEAFTQTYPNFTLMDENKMGDHDYTDDMAMDTDHLSTIGATQLTHRIDSLIQTLNINWDNNP